MKGSRRSREPVPPRDDLIVVQEGTGYATILFNRPEVMNAITARMWEELSRVVKDLGAEPSVHVLIFCGVGGKAFAAGADISELLTFATSGKAPVYYHLLEEALEAIASCPLPTIAMIDGYALGGGFEVALACDLRVASTRSRLGIPAAKLGAAVDPGSLLRLMSLVGPGHAKELLFTGRPIEATRAFEIGLVNHVVPPEALERTVLEITEAIARNAPRTVKTLKGLLSKLAGPFTSGLRREAKAFFITCFESLDFREGVEAFLEKRPPRFTGR